MLYAYIRTKTTLASIQDGALSGNRQVENFKAFTRRTDHDIDHLDPNLLL